MLRPTPLACRAPVGLAAVGALVLVGCGDPASLVFDRQGPSLSTERVEFGDVQVGVPAGDRVVLIRNPRSTPVAVEVAPGTPFAPNAFSFEAGGAEVPAGGTLPVTVRFTPPERGPHEAVVVVRTGRARDLREQSIVLVGIGAASPFTVAPERSRFGNVLVGTTRARPVRITNGSSERVEVRLADANNLGLCGTGGIEAFCLRPVDRRFREDERFVLDAGATRELVIEFRPSVAGVEERGRLRLSHCPQSACELDVSLSGRAVDRAVACEPQAIDFGPVNPGAEVRAEVTCTNVANRLATLQAVELAAGSSDAFRFEPAPLGAVLDAASPTGPGGELRLGVVYAPTALGDDAAQLRIVTDDPDPRRAESRVELSGAGGGPDISVSPAGVDFGLASLLAPSRRTVEVRNEGWAPLIVERAEVLADADHGAAAGFEVEAVEASVVPPGGSMRVTVAFQASFEGAHRGRLILASNDRDQPEAEVPLRGEGVNVPPCRVEVSETRASFGTLEVYRTARRPIELRNPSTSPCLVTGLRLVEGSDAEIALAEPLTASTLIPPEATRVIDVVYQPDVVADHQGTLEIEVADPQRPTRTVALTGEAVEATLLVAPNDIDFGTRRVGCAAPTRTVKVFNIGRARAVVHRVALRAGEDAFSLHGVPELPAALAAEGELEFQVGARGSDASAVGGVIEIESWLDGRTLVQHVALETQASEDGIQVDRFEQLSKRKADILFVADDSGCSTDEHIQMARSFGRFLAFADARDLDYHVAITSTDMTNSCPPPEYGRFVPLPGLGPASERVIRRSTRPSPLEVFQRNIFVGDCGGTERLLEGAYTALGPDLLGGHNGGFLRRDARLAIIGQTDEPEQSSRSVDFYRGSFQALKGFRNADDFTFSAISGGAEGCRGPTGNGGAAPRLAELAEATGGTSQPMCAETYDDVMERLAEHAFGFQSRFDLSSEPTAATIRVFVDDDFVPDVEPSGRLNWRYDAPTRSIRFTPLARPEPGSEIRVEYEPRCASE